MPVSGEIRTTVRNFGLDDPTGHRVLTIERLDAEVDVDALRGARLRMPGGSARGIKLTLRRGRSGRVSLAEAIHGGTPPTPAEARRKASQGMLLDIGPLVATDVRVRVEMSANPIVIQLRKAELRVQRESSDQPTRILLSHIQGQLIKPDPLPNAIEIHDGTGVVNLGSDPLVDLKVRVCVANGEMRLQIVVPERAPETTHFVTDSDRFMGSVAVGALNVASWFKDGIDVQRGRVDLPANRSCDDGP